MSFPMQQDSAPTKTSLGEIKVGQGLMIDQYGVLHVMTGSNFTYDLNGVIQLVSNTIAGSASSGGPALNVVKGGPAVGGNGIESDNIFDFVTACFRFDEAFDGSKVGGYNSIIWYSLVHEMGYPHDYNHSVGTTAYGNFVYKTAVAPTYDYTKPTVTLAMDFNHQVMSVADLSFYREYTTYTVQQFVVVDGYYTSNKFKFGATSLYLTGTEIVNIGGGNSIGNSYYYNPPIFTGIGSTYTRTTYVTPATPTVVSGIQDPFCIEAWIAPDDFTNFMTVYSQVIPAYAVLGVTTGAPVGYNGWANIKISLDTSGHVVVTLQEFSTSTPVVLTSASTLVAGDYSHIAVTRGFGKFNIFINGVKDANEISDAGVVLIYYFSENGGFAQRDFSSNFKQYIGGSIVNDNLVLTTGTSQTANGGYNIAVISSLNNQNVELYKGYIDSFRITRGNPRYSVDFTPASLTY